MPPDFWIHIYLLQLMTNTNCTEAPSTEIIWKNVLFREDYVFQDWTLNKRSIAVVLTIRNRNSLKTYTISSLRPQPLLD